MTLNKRIALDSIKTTSVTFAVQAFSFVVSAVIAALYGATGNTDSYFYALSLVLIFTTGISGILKSVFMPVFLRFKKELPKEENEMLGSFYFYFGVSLFVVWLLFVAVSYALTFVLHFKLGGIEPIILGKLLIEMSFLVILTGFVECYSTVYNSYQRFIVPLVTPLIRSLIFIGFVFATRKVLGVESLGIGNVVGEFVQLTILAGALRSAKIFLGFKFSLHPAVIRMAKIAIPPFLSNALTRVNTLVDSTFIAPLLIGGVTILNYSSKISGIPEMLLTGAFLTVILSHWSLSRAENGVGSVGDSLKKVLLVLGFIFIPVVSFMYFLRVPMVQIMYQRKNFTYELSISTAQFLGVYLVGILPLILGRVLTRAFLVMEDTWTPFWVGNFRFVLNIILDFLFIKIMGVIGIPLSTTVTSFAMFTFMYFMLRRRVRLQGEFIMALDYFKMLVSGLLSGLMVLWLYNMIIRTVGSNFIGMVESLVASCFVGVGLYLAVNCAVRSESVRLLKELKP